MLRQRFSSAIALLVLLAPPAGAQLVRGQVIDSLAGIPVGQGFVVLLDQTGTEVARTLTNSDGEFSLRAPRVGRYRLRSEIIAYRAYESHTFDLSIRTPTEITLNVLRVPVRLSSFEVVGDEQCTPPDESIAVAPVWEEARKALSAAAWTANTRQSRHNLHRYQRVESRHERLRQERIWLLEGEGTQPFASIQPDRLVTRGYIVRRGDRNRYFGPDANVLLHEGFQNTHCFWAERGSDEFEGLLGLSFKPVRGRGVTDIAGTLWLEPETAELRQIEYHYTDLPFEFESDDIGGSIHFARLASGAWILSKWEIRTPVVENERRMTSPGVMGTRQSLAGLQRIGGAVIEATGADGVLEYSSPEIVEVSGLAYDSSRSTRLTNHRVTVAGTGYSTRTDADGRFRFKTLLDGTYHVTLARLDSLGFDYGRARVEFEPGRPAELMLLVPPLETVYRYHCGSSGLPGGQYVVFGTVRAVGSNVPLDRVILEMSWIDAARPGHIPGSFPSRDEQLRTLGEERDAQRRVRSAQDGRFVFCPTPAGRPLMIVADDDAYSGPAIIVELRREEATVDDGTGPRTISAADRILHLDVDLAAENR